MHILERLAKKTEINGDGQPSGAVYSFEAGAWFGQNGLVSFDPANEMTTKKNDLETGEDQKGE